MPIPTIHDIASLLSAVEQGVAPAPLFFWGHQTDTNGQPAKACLSQWYPANFEVDGVHYPTAEHYMMAEKARLFGDEAVCAQILSSKTPKMAKDLGRAVRGFDSTIWQQQRVAVVERGNLAKFAQNPALLRYLLSTGDQVLVEASPYDTIWGIGLAENDPRASNPLQWRGQNLLGFVLMAVRLRL
jgi:ribA/ribD-fused uncharacterized protein